MRWREREREKGGREERHETDGRRMEEDEERKGRRYRKGWRGREKKKPQRFDRDEIKLGWKEDGRYLWTRMNFIEGRTVSLLVSNISMIFYE